MSDSLDQWLEDHWNDDTTEYRTGLALRDSGFDESEYDEEDERWHVQCSQCQALVINGHATHEHGCPNKRRAEMAAEEE